MEEIYYSNSENETLKIAEQFALTLNEGDIVLLDGDLGAGKTVFSKGIVSALSGGKITAVSPTFVLVNVYDTTPVVYHFDLYRINDVSELDAIGAEEYFYSDGVSLVEWPSRAANIFPNSAIKVYIEKVDSENRVIKIER
ncbi:MAG: tRNA (adenosine(37)-N6)-threonylcarbamoyltransferase complex ATPase subunit type 1 TsaE [Clostridia bacterium]|nr:tRNA (adenosine(37)-N6)-threonylcarbamoyltransferase complex ATPase subunit type 1 TsaE [Clostridia bacterium]